jgi:hypothetical protein
MTHLFVRSVSLIVLDCGSFCLNQITSLEMETECFHNKYIHLLSGVKSCSLCVFDDQNIRHKIVGQKPIVMSYEFSGENLSRYISSTHEYIEPFRDEYKVPLYEMLETTGNETVLGVIRQIAQTFAELKSHNWGFDFGSNSTKADEILCKLALVVNYRGELEYLFRNLIKAQVAEKAQDRLLVKCLVYFMYRGKTRDKTICHAAQIGVSCKLKSRREYFIKVDYWLMHELVCNGNLSVLET